jgi:tetratricopeptide (TPR) repeat protein
MAINSYRVHQLLEWLESEPNEPFNLYALAMEYKESQPEKAIEYLEKIRQVQPSYTPVYYHLAELYLDLKYTEQAEEIYKIGIQICTEYRNQHALAELQNAYQNFLYDA